MPSPKTAMGNSAEELLAFCDEVERKHVRRERSPDLCADCIGTFYPCDAARGAAVIRGALLWFRDSRTVQHDCFDSMANALRKLR